MWPRQGFIILWYAITVFLLRWVTCMIGDNCDGILDIRYLAGLSSPWSKFTTWALFPSVCTCLYFLFRFGDFLLVKLTTEKNGREIDFLGVNFILFCGMVKLIIPQDISRLWTQWQYNQMWRVFIFFFRNVIVKYQYQNVCVRLWNKIKKWFWNDSVVNLRPWT